MDLAKETLFSFIIGFVIMCLIYFILVFIFKKYKRNISKQKTAQLVVLILVLYNLISFILGLFFDINIYPPQPNPFVWYGG